MVINYPRLMVEISQPNGSLCRTCYMKQTLVSMISFFLLDIPFYYFTFQMMRKNRFTFRTKFAPGICFCIVKVFVDVASFFLSIFSSVTDEIDRTPIARFKYVIYDLKYLAQALYCAQICQILILFGVKFSKWLSFFSRLMQYYFTSLSVVKVVLSYINDVRNNSFYKPFYIIYNMINETYIRSFIVCLNFILLAVTSFFSSVSEYYPPKIRKPISVAIFLIAFFNIIGVVLAEFIKSDLFSYDSTTNPSRYLWRYNITFLVTVFLEDYATLFIITLLSIDEFSYGQDKKGNQHTLALDLIFENI